ncbi:rho GTPase-activating protein SYDE2 isoform X2 [Chiloscyllium plagiosum]|uniref:rho GTPase-activating protein SYDE2 isoform X2 n=1 Tax=Chiloscyllium plagiosum TaxID=36176 RepID=UPI001CB877FB|nr:rho GTPase-activating protein SYDE2 isoform X2 [Chiloscyllium plagiosum]
MADAHARARARPGRGPGASSEPRSPSDRAGARPERRRSPCRPAGQGREILEWSWRGGWWETRAPPSRAMADPLRRTLFAKLRGRKSKKSAGVGTRSQEGKAKLPEEQRRRRQRRLQQEAGPGVMVVGGVKVLAGSGSSGGGGEQQQEDEEEEEEGTVRMNRRPGTASGRGWQSPEQRRLEAAEGVGGVVGGGAGGQLSSPHPNSTADPPFHLLLSPGRRQSLDSQEEEEEEDYYDNPWLGGCERPVPAPAPAPAAALSPHGCDRSRHRKHSLDSAQEKERLRSRLHEAYYLLIHAMHGMPVEMESPARRGRLAALSRQSQDSVCSQSSVRALDSDAWSSDEVSPQPQVSDADSLSGKRRKGFASGSIANLVSGVARAPLPRSVSDGVINYVSCLADSDLEREQSGHGPAFLSLGEAGQTSCDAGSTSPCAIHPSECAQGAAQPCEGSPVLVGDSSCEVTKFRNPSDLLCGSCDKQDDSQGCFLKPPAVTVNKMQEWMHRGRMLSLEMKERISGSVRVSVPSGSLSGQATSKEVDVQKTSFPAPVRVQGNKAAPLPPSQSLLLTDFIETIHASSVIKRELKVTEATELNNHRPHINHITVSKKRNWLQQCTLNPQMNEETNASVAVELTNRMSSPNPLHESKQQPAVLPREHIQQNDRRHTEGNSLDHNEENDADDEGEIWYNPIPEDEEVDLSHIKLAVAPRISVAKVDKPVSSLQMKQCLLPGGDLLKGQIILGTSENCSESVQETQIVPVIDVNQGNSVNSTNPTNSGQLHRQTCVCKFKSEATMEEICVHRPPVSAATDPSNGPVCAVAVVATAATTTEFSPPSSPNPSKKGTAINWPFPEKIKSPRTVRKLSMKMKKLPELSRKLSVKGTSSHNCNDNHNSSPKGNHGSSISPGITTNAASRNVISRYHLDTSVASQSYKKKSSGNSKSASKGGYLSDGDSPELVAKSSKHSCENRPVKGNIASASHKTHSTEIDIDAFRHYSFVDQPKCSQYISGLMSVHFYGAEDLKPPRIDSRDVFCAIQVDSVNKARTALLTCRTTFLDMDHTFNIELENAQHLKLVVFSWEPTPRRNRVCCHGTVVLPTLFRVSKMHQLAVKLEPRGLIYVKLTLMEQWENSLDSPDGEREPVMFGVEARKVVEKENMGLRVPLLMQKCIVEIEKRGCQVVGLYRLCGSAAVKKELREAFERDSKAVGLSENLYPDINVITGVLKDYLRELPSPLITKELYETVLDAMAKQPLKITSSGCENDHSDSEYTVGLLDCLPEVEKATLKMLLDHLKLVASYHEVNKMTCQNLAVCFGPVLLSQRQETSNHSHRVFTDSEELANALDFKKHIEVLHYLLQLWPVQNVGTKEHVESNGSPELEPINCVRRRKQRPAVLSLTNTETTGVLRPRQVRLDSPSNRYAGDWSSCGESYLLKAKDESTEADYDDVPSEDTGSEEESTAADRNSSMMKLHAETKSKGQTYEAYVRMQKINPALEHRVNLKDLQESIDTLIGNLERELSKNKLNVTC